MDQLMAINVSTLVTHVIIVAFATLGNVEWLKNWIHPEKKRVYSLLSLILLSISAVMQMPFVPKWVTTFYNLFTLGNSFIQFGHTALIKIPAALLNKSLGIKTE
jgi:hypothetical protein